MVGSRHTLPMGNMGGTCAGAIQEGFLEEVGLETICWAPAWCYMLSLHPFISISRLPYLGDSMIVPIFQMRKHAQRGLLTCPGSHLPPVRWQGRS